MPDDGTSVTLTRQPGEPWGLSVGERTMRLLKGTHGSAGTGSYKRVKEFEQHQTVAPVGLVVLVGAVQTAALDGLVQPVALVQAVQPAQPAQSIESMHLMQENRWGGVGGVPDGRGDVPTTAVDQFRPIGAIRSIRSVRSGRLPGPFGFPDFWFSDPPISRFPDFPISRFPRFSRLIE
eukprot:gene17346-biopygen8508